MALVDEMVQNKLGYGVAIVRPPGHHASRLKRPSWKGIAELVKVAADFSRYKQLLDTKRGAVVWEFDSAVKPWTVKYRRGAENLVRLGLLVVGVRAGINCERVHFLSRSGTASGDAGSPPLCVFVQTVEDEIISS